MDRSSAAGAAFLKGIQSARERLSKYPEIGFQPSPAKGSRRLVVGDYVIDYDVGPEAIDITAIRHGRQSDSDDQFDDDSDYE
jgi:plasmid stabilization system protein ParE